MGIDCNLYLPPGSRIDDIELALVRSGGGRISYYGNKKQYQKATNGFEKTNTHSMVTLGGEGWFFYLHLDNGPVPGSFQLSSRSTKKNLAILRKLADVFGGFLVESDCDDRGELFPFNPLVTANDGEIWSIWQKQLHGITPISDIDIEKAAKYAAYENR